MFRLDELKKIVKKRKRIGRGGGRGGQSGRGKDGQLKRSGGRHEITSKFEGGQMSLLRRLPRRGFKNFMRTEYCILSVEQIEKNFVSGDKVDYASLRSKGLIKRGSRLPVKLLCSAPDTKISFPVHVLVDAWSKTAEATICSAGGSVGLPAVE